MAIEDTTRIVTIPYNVHGGVEEVNDFLKLGWVLLHTYVISVADADERNERPYFTLAWQHSRLEPEYPPYSFAKQFSEAWDSEAGKSRL